MYFPGKDKKGGDKKPSFDLASKWLTKELKFLNPKLYLIIGRVASEFFFPKQNFTELIFNNQKINKILAFVLPHPSPLNIKWFKDNPEFENKRLLEIRKKIHQVLK